MLPLPRPRAESTGTLYSKWYEVLAPYFCKVGRPGQGWLGGGVCACVFTWVGVAGVWHG